MRLSGKALAGSTGSSVHDVKTEPDQPLAVFQAVESVDLRSLPLTPEEAFVLACIDGQSSANDVSVASGLASDRVIVHLERLTELGALRRAAASAPPRSRRRPSEAAPRPESPRPESPRPQSPRPEPTANKGPPRPEPKRESPERSRRSPPAPPPAAPLDTAGSEPDPTLELELELQKQILALYSRLDRIDHFALLGVEPSSDRKGVKKAYFTLVGTYHPDRYYKKRLGHFTKKIDRIFQRLTEAHDTLSDERSRKDYEAYLAAQRRTRALDAGLQGEEELLKEVEQLLKQAQEQARKEHQLALRAPSMPPPVLPAPVSPAPLLPGSGFPWKAVTPRATSVSPAKEVPVRKPAPAPVAAPAHLVDDPAARRRALARKLGRTGQHSVAPPAQTVTAPAPAPGERHAAAKEDLKRRYERRMHELQRNQIERYAAAAEEALAAGNAVSALNAMRIAVGLAVDDPELGRRLAELETQVSTSMADSYLEQARYEENNSHYEEAARSYTRAAKGKPSADVLQSAAECYLKAGVELRPASDLARQAVQLAPERTDLRLTLAKVYEAAGMKQSAIGELQRTLEMAPASAKVKEWLKRLERGGV